MKVILKKISIRNFKGLRFLDFDFNHEMNYIHGENRTGKTSLIDAFRWVFDSKNSDGVSDSKFSIKPLNEKAKEINHLETSVELSLLVDGEKIKLKKIYQENWVTKNGTNDQIHQGHTTTYKIDDVKIATKSKWEKTIEEIFQSDKSLIILLSSPTYFCKEISWEKRREILTGLIPELNFQDIAGEKEFEDLKINFDKYTIQDYIKHCEEIIKGIRRQLDEIPVKMKLIDDQDEEYSKIDFAEISDQLEKLQSQLKVKERSLNTIDSNNKSAEIEGLYNSEISKNNTKIENIRTEILELQNQIRKLINDHEQKQNEKASKIKISLSEIDLEKNHLINEKKNFSELLKTNAQSIEKNENQLIKLRQEHKLESEKTFSFSGSNTCPTCKRDYDQNDIQGMIKLQEVNFSQLKAKNISEINAKGKFLSESNKTLINQNSEIKNKILEIENKINEIIREGHILDGKLSDLTLQSITLDTSKFDNQISEKLKLVDDLKEQNGKLLKEMTEKIESNKNSSDEEKRSIIISEIKTLNDEIKNLQEKSALSGILKSNSIMRKKFQNEEKELIKRHETYSIQLSLSKRLIHVYVSRLEGSINKIFQITDMKLFDVQLNGGIREVCTPTVNGVPYDDLNTATALNCGLDIINALSKHYGLCMPVFIDNRESITEIIPLENQVFNLVKDSDYKQLTVMGTK